MSHRTFLLFNLLQISSLSCLFVTISGFFSLSILPINFRLINPVVCLVAFSLFFGQNGRFLEFLTNVLAQTEILKILNSRTFFASFSIKFQC